MPTCTKCSSDVSDAEEKCTTCGNHIGFPNVRVAQKTEESDALHKRYVDALDKAQTAGSLEQLARFDDNMRKTGAVINVDLDFLYQFITKDDMLYSNYSLGVRGQLRKPATGQNDRHRRTIEAMLFGGYAEHIRYAALSLDGSGPSWGPFAMKLRDIAIADRATLLEDNSYNFIPKHNVQAGQDIPPGFTSTWEERHKLASSKLAPRISAITTDDEHAEILLTRTGNRTTDDFIEIHVYGSFDNKAVESVRGKSSAVTKDGGAFLKIIKEYLTNAGKSWVEA